MSALKPQGGDDITALCILMKGVVGGEQRQLITDGKMCCRFTVRSIQDICMNTLHLLCKHSGKSIEC